MAPGVNQKLGDNQEVRAAFKDWDPRIDQMLKYVDSVLEWRVSLISSMTFTGFSAYLNH